MCDSKKNHNGIRFDVGPAPSSPWEKIWKRLFCRHRGINRIPRAWSNRELQKIGALLSGSVLNCSGWCDEDKQGGFYREYFPRATEYHVSMRELRIYEGRDHSVRKRPDVAVDLDRPLSPSLVGRYDIVICHTVLEHVFNVFTAFENLTTLSRDIVIVVVSWCQRVHENN